MHRAIVQHHVTVEARVQLVWHHYVDHTCCVVEVIGYAAKGIGIVAVSVSVSVSRVRVSVRVSSVRVRVSASVPVP